MTSTLTTTDIDKIRGYITNHHLVTGLGTRDKPCSIAAINLALTGALTDEIPGCMSGVIGGWVIQIQDHMPDTIRNSTEWKHALINAAGTGRNPDDEKTRLDIILEHMWTVTLPIIQPVADAHGFGVEWATMCLERTATATYAASASASAAAAYDAARAADYATDAATNAAFYAAYAAYAATAGAWDQINPAGLLQQLVAVGE